MEPEETYKNSLPPAQSDDLIASMRRMKIIAGAMDPKTLATAINLSIAKIKRKLSHTPDYSNQEEFDPKKVFDFISMMNMFSKSGILRFNDIFKNLYKDLGYLLGRGFIELKMAYSIFYNTQANDREASEMDSDIRNYKFDDLVHSFENSISKSLPEQHSERKADDGPEKKKGESRKGVGQIGYFWIDYLRNYEKRYYAELKLEGILYKTAIEKEAKYHKTVAELEALGTYPPSGAEEVARSLLYPKLYPQD